MVINKCNYAKINKIVFNRNGYNSYFDLLKENKQMCEKCMKEIEKDTINNQTKEITVSEKKQKEKWDKLTSMYDGNKLYCTHVIDDSIEAILQLFYNEIKTAQTNNQSWGKPGLCPNNCNKSWFTESSFWWKKCGNGRFLYADFCSRDLQNLKKKTKKKTIFGKFCNNFIEAHHIGESTLYRTNTTSDVEARNKNVIKLILIKMMMNNIQNIMVNFIM